MFDMKKMLAEHDLWCRGNGGVRAELRGADLRRVSLCGATIDGAAVRPADIGGPGWILAALTAAEWDVVRAGRTATKNVGT